MYYILTEAGLDRHALNLFFFLGKKHVYLENIFLEKQILILYTCTYIYIPYMYYILIEAGLERHALNLFFFEKKNLSVLKMLIKLRALTQFCRCLKM